MNTQKTYYTVPSGLSNVCMEPDSEALPPAKRPKRDQKEVMLRDTIIVIT